MAHITYSNWRQIMVVVKVSVQWGNCVGAARTSASSVTIVDIALSN
ncbi:hypothetical protein LC613_08660 [Nostoc sphaeroides CHAB 2801]|nr:hypothetical protein [Nostoc sphaeroides]MCC5628186.1 hypothetical protein [Nostoc sphaeroides CHAB 2801]